MDYKLSKHFIPLTSNHKQLYIKPHTETHTIIQYFREIPPLNKTNLWYTILK